MRDFERIREARKDLTSYVVHLVKSRYVSPTYTPSYEVLKEILACGYFKAGFSPVRSSTTGRIVTTIRGPNPAVCFTEQPLYSILISNRTLASRYPLYGVAVKKEHLYQYGGRPVIYGDGSLIGSRVPEGKAEYQEDKEIYTGGLLHPDVHYLWVKYDPCSNPAFRDYPIDWTHEREWRCIPLRYHYLIAGSGALWDIIDGVPILLPDDDEENHAFKILVSKDDEALDLKRWINEELPMESDESRILTCYFQKLRKARIISFEEVRRHLDEGNEKWARIEDLPPE